MPITRQEAEAEVVTLTDKINTAIKNGLTDDAFTYFYTLDPLDLVMLRVNDGPREIKNLLNNPLAEPFWENKFNQLSLKSDTSFQFRNPEPQSKADFYCGYILYLAAIKNQGSDIEKYNQYLDIAMTEFHSFHATHHMLTNMVSNSSHDLSKLRELCDYIQTHKDMITEFKTPGFLLLADTYFHIALVYQELRVPEMSIAYFKACWKNLHLAELFENNSTIDIHNAYFNRGLILSNRFGLTSISDMKEHFDAIASNAIPDAAKFRLEEEALDFCKKKINEGQSATIKQVSERYAIEPARSFNRM